MFAALSKRKRSVQDWTKHYSVQNNKNGSRKIMFHTSQQRLTKSAKIMWWGGGGEEEKICGDDPV